MTTDAVFVVLVTYNRLPYLQQVLQALALQTVQPQKIIVVNNGSTDGTEEWLSKQSSYTVITQENSGGAGGFHSGIKQAFEAGADWIWTMDDDVVPDRNCLEKLLAHKDASLCLHPIHFYPDGTMQEEEKWFDPATCSTTAYFNASYKGGKQLWFRNTASFEGMLVHKSIVQKIGFPDPRFFLFHDDLLYGWLAHHHTNVSVVAAAIMRKLDVPQSKEAGYRYLYYAFRNLWLLAEYTDAETPELKRYRCRRIRGQFMYEAYKILRLKEYGSRRKALHTLWKAWKVYRRKESGKAAV